MDSIDVRDQTVLPSMREPWQTRKPDLIADVRLYATEEGGRRTPARLGFGCPCFTALDQTLGGWDARMQLRDHAFEPGTELRVGFVFLSQGGIEAIKEAGRFYLWEGRFIGEAEVVEQPQP